MKTIILIYFAVLTMILSACGSDGGSSAVVNPNNTPGINTPSNVTDTWKGSGATVNNSRAEDLFNQFGATGKYYDVLLGKWIYVFGNPAKAAQKGYVQRYSYNSGCNTEEFFRPECSNDFFVSPMNPGCQKASIYLDDDCKNYVGNIIVWLEFTAESKFNLRIQGLSSKGIYGSDSKKIMEFTVANLTDSHLSGGFKLLVAGGAGFENGSKVITIQSNNAAISDDSFGVEVFYGDTSESLPTTKIWAGTVQRITN